MPKAKAFLLGPPKRCVLALWKHKTARCFSVHDEGEKGTLTDCRSVAVLGPIEAILLLQQFQRLPQLEYGGESMLAGIAVAAAASKAFDLPTAVIKLDLVREAALHNSPPVAAVNAEIDYPVVCIVVVLSLRNGAGDLHSAEVVQLKAVVITARDIDVILFI